MPAVLVVLDNEAIVAQHTFVGDIWERRVDPTRFDENHFALPLLPGSA